MVPFRRSLSTLELTCNIIDDHICGPRKLKRECARILPIMYCDALCLLCYLPYNKIRRISSGRQAAELT